MNKKVKLFVTIFVLGICWATTYSLSFIQYLLYDPFKEALGASNTQLGLLMTIFGLGNVIGAPIGGWLADRFDCRKIFLLSLLGNGLLALYFAFNMTYSNAIIVWVGLAATGLAMNYPSHIKIVRLLADENSQGKIFGMNEAFVGVGNVIINGIFLYLFARYMEGVAGLKAVILAIAGISFLCLTVSYFIIPKTKEPAESNEKKEKEKLTVKDFFIVLKNPATWMVGIGIFSIYSFSVTMSYFTPYFTSVLGVTVAFSGSLSIIRTHVLRLGGAPFGGWLADKIGSVSKVLIAVYGSGIVVLLIFMNLPSTVSVSIIIAITLAIGWLVYMGRGIYYAVASEINIPRKYAASTVGMAAALGFSPDLFQFILFGKWIDTYGNTGYTYMFIYQAIVLTIGIFSSFYILKHKKANKESAIAE